MQSLFYSSQAKCKVLSWLKSLGERKERTGKIPPTCGGTGEAVVHIYIVYGLEMHCACRRPCS